MQSLNSYIPTQSTAILLVGSPGSGKTTTALQFPRPYVFDADNNLGGPVRYLKSIGKDLSEVKFNLGTVKEDGSKVTPFNRWNWMAQCLQNAAKDDEVETIILDSLSALQDTIKFDIFRQRIPQPNSRTPMVTEASIDKAQLTEPEWGVYARYFNTLITSLKQTGKIIIVTAHQESRFIEEDHMQKITLALEGQMRFKFAGLFSDVINPVCKLKGLNSQEVERFYRTIPIQESDERGLKTSFLIPATFTDINDVLKQIKEEKQSAEN